MRGREFFAQIASAGALAGVSTGVRDRLARYFAGVKVADVDGRHVVGSLFPPYPSRAFTRFLDLFRTPPQDRPVYCVSLGVTNRCDFACIHCSNAGRRIADMPLDLLRTLSRDLQDAGATRVLLSGGEPLLRRDLDAICRLFDDRTVLSLSTTGWDLTAERARGLKAAGLYGIGVSLDSDLDEEHDRIRGRAGALAAARQALGVAREAGLYTYAATVAWPELLDPERFFRFLRFARDAGAVEVNLLEPIAVGRLAGRRDRTLRGRHRARILRFQDEVAQRDDLPLLSTDTYEGDADAFGCQAGVHYVDIDGSGEVCPCKMVPLSFGNVGREPLGTILDRMGRHFRHPRAQCVARVLARHVPAGPLPMEPDASLALCQARLPASHGFPALFAALPRSP